MKNFLIFIILGFMAYGCDNSNVRVQEYSMHGINSNSHPKFLCFITEKEGYLFASVTIYKKMKEEKLNNPYFTPKYTEEATIYKTIDGGKNWKKIINIKNSSFYNEACFDSNNVYINFKDSNDFLNNRLLQFNIKSSTYKILNFKFQRMGSIWINNDSIFVNSMNNGHNRIYKTDKDFKKIDSIDFEHKLKGNIIEVDRNLYTITWDSLLLNITNYSSIKLDKKVDVIDFKKNENIFIFGGTLNKSVVLWKKQFKEKKLVKIKQIENYTFIEQLKSNNKLIITFIGNTGPFFNDYNLLYSIDRGNTWQTKRLNAIQIRPNFLIENILYIYDEPNTMQKIIFPIPSNPFP